MTWNFIRYWYYIYLYVCYCYMKTAFMECITKTFWHDGVKSPGVVKVLQYFSYINELSIMKQYYPIMSQIFSKHWIVMFNIDGALVEGALWHFWNKKKWSFKVIIIPWLETTKIFYFVSIQNIFSGRRCHTVIQKYCQNPNSMCYHMDISYIFEHASTLIVHTLTVGVRYHKDYIYYRYFLKRKISWYIKFNSFVQLNFKKFNAIYFFINYINRLQEGAGLYCLHTSIYIYIIKHVYIIPGCKYVPDNTCISEIEIAIMHHYM